MLPSFIEWGVLSETGDKGVYAGGKPTFNEEPGLIAWMVETSLHARENEAAAANDLLDSPGMFPFWLTRISGEQLSSLSPRLDILRHSLDEDLSMLRGKRFFK